MRDGSAQRPTADGEDGQLLVENLVSVSEAFEGSEGIAVARDLARSAAQRD